MVAKILVQNIVLISIISLMTGCSMINKKDPDVIVTTEPMLTKPAEGSVDKVASADSVNLDKIDEKEVTLGSNIIYFDYNQYSVENPLDKKIIKKYSAYLKKYDEAIVRIEGHADERGSRAYNLALGEKRANSAKDYLMTYGISGKRISVISYGKEKPVNSASTPLAWSQNRRSVTVKVN